MAQIRSLTRRIDEARAMLLLRTFAPLLLLLTVTAALSAAPPAVQEFLLKDGERVVFFGDSITQAGMYVAYVDVFLRTRFPERDYEVINRGISSETISGTSEPDHDPRRPWAHKRFTRDIASLKPDVVIACFGMNDGNYYPFGQERFEKYQAGVRRLIQRTRQEAGGRLVLMTPPPFDPYRRRAGDPDATDFGYKYPAIDYDDTLTAYSKWLLTLRDEGFTVADVHAASNQHLAQRREEKVSFYLAGDAVHPGPFGHWLMAQTLLQALRAPAEVAFASIDAQDMQATAGDVSHVASEAGGLSFRWKTPLPMPLDPEWEAESVALEKIADRLNRFRLRITNLPASEYQLNVDDAAVAKLSAEKLADGIDLTSLAALPMNRAAVEVLKLARQRERLLYGAWRKSLTLETPEAAQQLVAEAQQAAAELQDVLDAKCQPKEHKFVLLPVSE